MNTLIHLCKKDFAFAKPWILGTWLALVAGTFFPSLMPATGMPLPWAAIRQWIPALLVFLTVTRIIHCDSFTGTTGFMGTRPVGRMFLLGCKLAFIDCTLVLPAALLSLLHPVLMGVELTLAEHLLLFLEMGLFFAVFAAAAVLVAVLTRSVGTMALLSVIIVIFIALLAKTSIGRSQQLFGCTLEEAHLRDSVWLVSQALLTIAAISIAMSWVAKRRWPITPAMFVLSAGCLIVIGKGWKWNFVEHLAKDAPIGQILKGTPALVWLDEPRLVSYEKREGIPYAQVIRPHRIEGLKDGWKAKMVESESEARFADGTVWKSHRAARPDPTERFGAEVLTQMGIRKSKTNSLPDADPFGFRVLFECEETRLSTLRDRRASIHGNGTFQLDQPYIAAVMPLKAGTIAINGRSQYRIDSLNVIDGQISLDFSTRGIALKSKGDGAGGFLRLNLLLFNPETQQIATSGGGSGTTGIGDDWKSMHRTYSLDQNPGGRSRPDADAFLKGARLYVIAVHYGGTITLAYEIPDMVLDVKH